MGRNCRTEKLSWYISIQKISRSTGIHSGVCSSGSDCAECRQPAACAYGEKTYKGQGGIPHDLVSAVCLGNAGNGLYMAVHI